MQENDRLSRYLEQVEVELIIANFFESEPWWEEHDFVPDFHKFYFLIDGDCYFEVDGTTYHAQTGDLCLLPAGMRQSYYLSERQLMKKYWCHFNAMIGERQMGEVISSPLIVSVRQTERITQLFQRLILLYEKGGVLETLRQRAVLLELLYEYFSLCGELSVRPSIYSNEFTKVMDYIDLHFDQSICVEDLAELIHLQPNYFIKYFKKNFGDSPMKYVNKLRVEKAKKLLKNSSLPVAEIAKRIGIEDRYYFSKLFKKYAGVSPRSYREI